MISSLDELERALKILRAHGVYEFELKGLKMKLGDLPNEQVFHVEQPESAIPTQDMLDQMVGMPPQGLDDPFLNYSVSEPLADENTETEG